MLRVNTSWRVTPGLLIISCTKVMDGDGGHGEVMRRKGHVRTWCGGSGANECLRLVCACITHCFVFSVKRLWRG